MDGDIVERRHFLKLFAGAFATGVTGLGLTTNPAEAFSLLDLPPAPFAFKAMGQDQFIDLTPITRPPLTYPGPQSQSSPRRRSPRRRPRRGVRGERSTQSRPS